MGIKSRGWHHRPCHVFEPDTMYMITGGTLHKKHFFKGGKRLSLLQGAIFQVFGAFEWQLDAWAVFSNHYHVIAASPEDADNLPHMMQRLHSQTARVLNRMDGKV